MRSRKMGGARDISSTLICSLLISGCASLSPQEGFKDVQGFAADRVPATLMWNTDEGAGREIDLAVRGLLSRTMTVDDAVQIGVINNPSLQAIYEDIGIAQADLVQAGLLQNPVFYSERRLPRAAAEFDLTQSLVDLFFIPLRTKVAESGLQAAKLRVASAIIEHVARTKQSYYELQGELQNLEMRRFVLKATEASALAARKLFVAGNIKEIESQNERALANQARIALAMVENEVIQKRERLNVLLGLWGKNTEWNIDERLPAIPANEAIVGGLERLAVTKRFDLESEKQELDALGYTINLAGYGAILTEASLGGHSEREPEGKTTAGPSIELSIPIFNQGQPQRARAQAEFRRKAAHFMQHAIEIRSEVRANFSEMMTARRKAEFYQREVLPLQAAMLDQTQLQYNGMFMSVFDLLQMKRNQIQSAQECIEALRDYWVARTRLELSVGGRIADEHAAAAPPVSADLSGVAPAASGMPVASEMPGNAGHHHHSEHQ